MSYSWQFASAFCGPSFVDCKACQLPPDLTDLARRTVERDILEGASTVLVKPAGYYLDIVCDIREMRPFVPIAVHHVSGQYSMLKKAYEANIIPL